MQRDDLVGAIMRITGGRGINPDMALTLTGDKAKHQPRLRGLFKKGGTADMSDLAELLRIEQGYDVRDGTHLEELIREQAAGNPVYSMERNEREAAQNEERKYRDEINKRAAELGLKQARGKRTLEMVETDIAREERRLSDIEAQAEREAIIAADAIDDAIGEDMTESDFMRWLSDDIAGTYTEEEIQRAQEDQADRENARTEARSIADTEERAQGDSRQRDGNQPAAQEGRGTEGGARGDDEGFSLTQQTNEQAAEQFAQQQAGDGAEPTKAQEVKRSKAAAETFELGQDGMDNLTGQGGLFDGSPAPGTNRDAGDGNWLGAASSFVQNYADEYGPGKADARAMEAAKNGKKNDVTLETSIRPSGKEWYVAYVSDGEGGFDSVAIGSKQGKSLGEVVSEAEAERAKRLEKASEIDALRKGRVEGARKIGIRVGQQWKGAETYCWQSRADEVR